MAKATNKILEFRKLRQDGEEVILPYSGITVKVRPISLTSLVRRNLIPADLFAMAMAGFPELEAAAAGAVPSDLSKVADMALGVDKWQIAVLTEMMIEPPFSEEAGREDALSLEDFAGLEGDVQFLMGLAQIPVRNWEEFRQRQVERLRDMENGEGASDQTE